MLFCYCRILLAMISVSWWPLGKRNMPRGTLGQQLRERMSKGMAIRGFRSFVLLAGVRTYVILLLSHFPATISVIWRPIGWGNNPIGIPGQQVRGRMFKSYGRS